MKIEIKYFTSTGNTLWMARFAKEYFEKMDHTVKISNSEVDGMEYDDDSNMVGVFYPVWGSNLPEPMGLPLLASKKSNRKMFFIGNCAKFTGDTGLHWKALIEEKLGYDVFYVDHVALPMNVNVPWWTWAPVPDQKKKEKLFEEAKSDLTRMFDEILEGKSKERGGYALGVAGGKFQRHHEIDAYRFWQKMMKIDEEKCTNCKLCEKICPNDNGKVVDKKLIRHEKFNENCMFCLRCYNLCPTQAFLVGDKTKDTKHYKRYLGAYKNMAKVLLDDMK